MNTVRASRCSLVSSAGTNLDFVLGTLSLSRLEDVARDSCCGGTESSSSPSVSGSVVDSGIGSLDTLLVLGVADFFEVDAMLVWANSFLCERAK